MRTNQFRTRWDYILSAKVEKLQESLLVVRIKAKSSSISAHEKGEEDVSASCCILDAGCVDNETFHLENLYML